MKRYAIFLLSLTCLWSLTGCGTSPVDDGVPQRTLEEVTNDYTLEEAKEDGCLVHENGDVTSGQEAFDQFLKDTSRGWTARLRVVNYYELGDPSQYAAEYYETVKDDYPKLFVSDVVFEDGEYRVTFYEEGELHTWNFAYLIEDHFESDRPSTLFTDGTIYFLYSEQDVTWDEVERRILDSWVDNNLPFYVVYQDYNFK